MASASQVVRQEDRVPAKARAHVEGPDGPPRQPTIQRRPDGVPIAEEVVPAVPPPTAADVNVLALVDHLPCCSPYCDPRIRPPSYPISYNHEGAGGLGSGTGECCSDPWPPNPDP